MFHIFLEGPAPKALRTRLLLRSTCCERKKEGTLTAYCEAVNYLLETYATDDMIVETDANMMLFTNPFNKSGTEYVKALCNKAIISKRVRDEYELNRIVYPNRSAPLLVYLGNGEITLEYMIWLIMPLCELGYNTAIVIQTDLVIRTKQLTDGGVLDAESKMSITSIRI